MDISVVLCTYNRSQSLRKALESVSASVLPETIEWEVLIVDNNSSDATREVSGEFCRRDPKRFRYLFEAQQGKSRALNTGVREAAGRFLAFMDDDVIVEPRWLHKLMVPMEEGEWVGVGGRVLWQEKISPPRWLPLDGPYSLAGMLTMFDQGEMGCQLDLPPFGTNMAFRRSVFDKYGTFRTDMGPTPGSEIRNEDTEFGRRLLGAGERLWYEPSAIVYHEVVQSRLRKEYFLHFWYDHGRAAVLEKGRQKNVMGVPRFYLASAKLLCLTIPVRVLRWLLSLDSKRRFYQKGRLWSTFGQLRELCRQR